MAELPNFQKLTQYSHALANQFDLFHNIPMAQQGNQSAKLLRRIWDNAKRFGADLQLLVQLLQESVHFSQIPRGAIEYQFQNPDQEQYAIVERRPNFKILAQYFHSVADKISFIPTCVAVWEGDWPKLMGLVQRIQDCNELLQVDLELLAPFIPGNNPQLMEIHPEIVNGQVQTPNDHHDQLSLHSSNILPSGWALTKTSYPSSLSGNPAQGTEDNCGELIENLSLLQYYLKCL
ncbi:hypothetical protein HOY80DRAFT_1137178 [Tuber brumale]|nr:hypothetical protein HOY80DRAFT_1137178 [Tuber brumale]